MDGMTTTDMLVTAMHQGSNDSSYLEFNSSLNENKLNIRKHGRLLTPLSTISEDRRAYYDQMDYGIKLGSQKIERPINELKVFNEKEFKHQNKSEERQEGRPRPLSIEEANMFEEEENNRKSIDPYNSEFGTTTSSSNSVSLKSSNKNFHEDKNSHNSNSYKFHDCDEHESTYVDMSGVHGASKEELTNPLLHKIIPGDVSQLCSLAREETEHTTFSEPSGARVDRKTLTVSDHHNLQGGLDKKDSHRYSHDGSFILGANRTVQNKIQREYG